MDEKVHESRSVGTHNEFSVIGHERERPPQVSPTHEGGFSKPPNTVSPDLLPYLKRVETEAFVEETVSQRARNESLARRILHNPIFDYLMGILIVSNMCVMIIETDLAASQEESLSGTTHWTQIFGWVVLLIFVMELLMRLAVYRFEFVTQDPWNVFDFIIVVTDVIFSIVGIVAGDTFPVSVLRIFRLAKLARVSKVLRVFPELRLLLAGLMSAMTSIFWGTLLLLFCLLVWSMIAVLFIHPLNKHIVYENCDRCPRAYSSVMQACLTFWQQIVCGDSWGEATIPLIEKYPSTLAFFIPLFLNVGMAVANLIVGVVVSVAQQARSDMEQEDFAERALAKLKAQTTLLQLCKQMDVDKRGTLTHEEILSGLDQPGDFRDLVADLGISRADFDIIWTILDTDATGSVSYKELVNRLCTMRRSDLQFMLAHVKYYVTQVQQEILDQVKINHEEMKCLQTVAQDVKNVVRMEKKRTMTLEEKVLSRIRLEREDSGFSEEALGDDHERDKNTQARVGMGSATPAKFAYDETWFNEVIDRLQKQLKDSLMDIKCKIAPQLSSTSAVDLRLGSTETKPDLPVMSNKQPCGLSPSSCARESNPSADAAVDQERKSTKASQGLCGIAMSVVDGPPSSRKTCL